MAASERHKVGGKNADPPIGQFPLPPVVLGLCAGDDCDLVAGGEAQVARIHRRELVHRRDDQRSAGGAGCKP